MAAITTTVTAPSNTTSSPLGIPALPTPMPRLRAFAAAFRTQSRVTRSADLSIREQMGPGLQVQFDAASMVTSGR